MFEPNEVLQVSTGRGSVSAEGIAPVKVRYKLVVERRAGTVLAHGTLAGTHAALRPIWLTPDATLHLKTGRTVAISVTDLSGDVADFEGTEPVMPG
ncbi:hypothetical protein [Methylobacterium sp. Leaf118]|uniref:hypothetical protein n=1 Tax=Methylobacterium sp. Leaf118 TaxID=2876562 RepID=UPI001E405809|nr:hypothetical protein [Methylobacterium sp. Leaf118]